MSLKSQREPSAGRREQFVTILDTKFNFLNAHGNKIVISSMLLMSGGVRTLS